MAEPTIFVVDDDEVPRPGWLDRLFATRERSGADVVTGAVVPVFSTEPAACPGHDRDPTIEFEHGVLSGRRWERLAAP